jgi:hypothetical protein
MNRGREEEESTGFDYVIFCTILASVMHFLTSVMRLTYMTLVMHEWPLRLWYESTMHTK